MDDLSGCRYRSVRDLGQHVNIHHVITIGFTVDSFPEGPPAVFAGLVNCAFRLNNEHDVVVMGVHDDGITVRTVPMSFDVDGFVPTEFTVGWEDVDGLVYV